MLPVAPAVVTSTQFELIVVMMDRLPRDALSLIVEALLPCERKAARWVCRTWRLWPCRPSKCADYRRPGPVARVSVFAAMLAPPGRPRGPLRLADPNTGHASWWWGMACRTVVLELGPETARRAHQAQEIEALISELLCQLMPNSRHLVVDPALLDAYGLDAAWQTKLQVVAAREPARANYAHFPVEVATTAKEPALAPWGVVLEPMNGRDFDCKLGVSPGCGCTSQGHNAARLSCCPCQMHCVQTDCYSSTSTTDGKPVFHRFWSAGAPVEMRCEVLSVTIGCEFGDLSFRASATHSFPLLRALRIRSRSPSSNVGCCQEHFSRPCVAHVARVIRTASKLRSVHVGPLDDCDLAEIVRALGQRDLHPVDLHFTGSQDQLFLLVMGCSDQGQLRQDHPFARRQFVLASVTMRCPSINLALRDLIVAYQKNARTLEATAAALRSLTMTPTTIESEVGVGPWKRQATDVFPGLVRLAAGSACVDTISRSEPRCPEPAEELLVWDGN